MAGRVKRRRFGDTGGNLSEPKELNTECRTSSLRWSRVRTETCDWRDRFPSPTVGLQRRTVPLAMKQRRFCGRE